jgi:hypothetical protein
VSPSNGKKCHTKCVSGILKPPELFYFEFKIFKCFSNGVFNRKLLKTATEKFFMGIKQPIILADNK